MSEENRLSTTESAPVPMRTKLAFGIGASGESATNWVFNALTFFYYNQILGLSGTLTGAAVMLAIVIDGITDPVMGSISDRFRSRFGRRHLFMYLAPAPLAFTVYAIFNPPADLGSTGLFLWFTVMTVSMRVFLTLFAVPHLALGAELSDDYEERSTVMSYNNFFAFWGGVTMHLIVWFAVFPQFTDGQRNPDAYGPIVIACMLIILGGIFGSAWFTRDRIPMLKQPPPDMEHFGLRRLALDIFDAVRNRNYLYLLLGLFFLSVMLGTRETLGIYMVTFFWELSPQQIGWLFVNALFGYTLAFVLTRRLHHRFDKRRTIVAMAAGLSIIGSLATTSRLLGLAPDNSTWSLVIFIICCNAFSSACGAILNISVMSALADIADEHELITGRRQEGVFYSARSMFAKTTNAIGHGIAGVALDIIEFPTGAVPGTIDADKLFALGVVEAPFALCFGLLGACLYAGYRLDRRRHAEIQSELGRRALIEQPA